MSLATYGLGSDYLATFGWGYVEAGIFESGELDAEGLIYLLRTEDGWLMDGLTVDGTVLLSVMDDGWTILSQESDGNVMLSATFDGWVVDTEGA